MTDWQIQQNTQGNGIIPLPPGYNPLNDAFNICTQGLANGFGTAFYNMRDPNVRRNNEPVRNSPSCHVPTLITNILFYGGLAVGIAGLNRFLSVGATVGIIIGTYLLYLIVACCFGQLRQYIQNMKNNDDYGQTYRKMQMGAGFFTFWIQCYHYQTRRTSKGKTSRRKVVTHTATQRFNVTASIDQSGDLTSIGQMRPVIFMHYLKRFYFTDAASQHAFQRSYNGFVHRHTRDVYQNHSFTFDIDGFQQYVSFTLSKMDNKSVYLFYIFTALAVGIFYAWIAQMKIARYDVGILKRLTVT